MTRRSRSSDVKNSTTPPTVPSVTVSEFVRGKIYETTSPTVVFSHGAELGTWFPRGTAPSGYYSYSNAAGTIGGNVNLGAPTADSTPTVMFASTRSMTPTTPVPTEVLAGLTQSLSELTKILSNESNVDEEETNG